MPTKKETFLLGPDPEEHVEFFESFLDAVENGYQVSFAHTRTGLKMKVQKVRTVLRRTDRNASNCSCEPSFC